MMSIDTAISEYLLFKRGSGISQASIKDYEYHTLPLLRYFSGSELENISLGDVLRFNAYICDKYNRLGTRYSYIRNSRLFFKWALDFYDGAVIKFNPDKIKLPRRPTKDVYQFTAADIQLLFDSVRSNSPWLTLRNKAILSLLLGSGLRLHEVVGLKLVNMHLDSTAPFVRVLGKGSKARSVGISTVSVSLIREYMRLCPFNGSVFVFYDRYGNKLTDYAVKVLIYRLKLKTGIPFSAHSLRHNYATMFVNFNLDTYGRTGEMELAAIMGHSSPAVTQDYIHIAMQERSVKSYVDVLSSSRCVAL